MYAINVSNVNEAYYKCMLKFRHDIAQKDLVEVTTRGERRLKMRGPVATTYRYPRERVLFDAVRDANPFFHFMEALWLLAWRNDVAWLEQWLPRIKDFSDDGETFYGAYGARIADGGQHRKAIERLRKDPASSRAVIAIYQPIDSEYEGNDLPCNTTLFLGIDEGRLNLTVANRSNDMIWGAYGANVVQFSTLQEYLAAQLGAKMGWYCQVSNNCHIYPDKEVTKRALDNLQPPQDHYDSFTSSEQWCVRPFDMFDGCTDVAKWDAELSNFMHGNKTTLRYFKDVAEPMRVTYQVYKEGQPEIALRMAENIAAEDWRFACREWIQRRLTKKVAP